MLYEVITFFARVGRYIRIKILRGDEERTFNLKVAKVPPEELKKMAEATSTEQLDSESYNFV